MISTLPYRLMMILVEEDIRIFLQVVDDIYMPNLKKMKAVFLYM